MYMFANVSKELRERWGRNIESGRKALGLTQAAFAHKLNVEQPTVARWEAGSRVPRDGMKVEIANLLHQDVRVLFPLTRTAA